MVAGWSEWQAGWEPDKATPYAHWWAAFDGKLPANQRGLETIRIDPYQYFRQRGRASVMSMADGAISVIGKGYGDVPLALQSKNQSWPNDYKKDWITPELLEALPEVPSDTVIVGVVDTGIALGHRAFRLPDGKSRIIAAWQQSARWARQSPEQALKEYGGNQDYLPFGRELYADEIDQLIARHSRGDRLDEDAFNRDARLVEPEFPRGQRDLDFRAAHGTHVMDLAAGSTGDPDFANRVRMIVVNLPAQSLHGSAGNFLEFFAAFAIDRIVSLADALWHKLFPGKDGAFPIAVNFSYVMQAGPHNGARPLDLMLRDMIRSRGKDKPLSICVPIGNGNLGRSFARIDAAHSGPLVWQLMPADMTPNFIEIWSDPERPTESPTRVEDFSLWITPPGGAPQELPVPVDGKFSELKGIARVYARFVEYLDEWDVSRCSVQFVICTCPTLVETDTIAPAPAGAWSIKIATATGVGLSAYIQSDQSSHRGRKTGLQSYFNDPAYRPWRDDIPAGLNPTRYGHARDSFSYPYYEDAASDLEVRQGPVLRRGTANALSSSLYINSIAGYRLSDGAPALYSATPRPRIDQPEYCIVMPIQMAYPTDDGPAHPGVLAAGARDGSSVSFRGTSMACAMATRQVALTMLDWLDHKKKGGMPDRPGGPLALQTLAKSGSSPPHYEPAAPLKIGAGRLPYPKGIRPLRQPRRT